MKTIRATLIILLALALSGCVTTGNLADKLRAFEALGVTEAEIAGKFSHTKYTKEDGEKKTVHRLTHTNLWIPRVYFVREAPKPE